MEQPESKTANEGLKIVGQQVEPSITFHPGDPMKEVMRIDRDGVRVNPEYSVDEATQHVLNALTRHIQHTVKHAVEHAVEQEREACAKMAEEVGMGKRWFNDLPSDIRARGQDPMPLFDDWPGGFKK